MNVAILGASDRKDRYAHRAMLLLEEKGHRVFLINPSLSMIGDRVVRSSLTDISESIDTITVYVRMEISSEIADEILASKPRRIIFNPGTENAELAARARNEGIVVTEGCTLVMLSTGQF